MREGEAGDGARHAGGERALRRGGNDPLRVRVRVEVPARPARRDLTEVHDQRAPARVPRDPEASSADVAGFGPGHGEREGHGDGRIGGVAPLLQDVDPDAGRCLLGRRHRAAASARDLVLGREGPARDEQEGAEKTRREALHPADSMCDRRLVIPSLRLKAGAEERSWSPCHPEERSWSPAILRSEAGPLSS